MQSHRRKSLTTYIRTTPPTAARPNVEHAAAIVTCTCGWTDEGWTDGTDSAAKQAARESAVGYHRTHSYMARNKADAVSAVLAGAR